jgi:hypothetical protein
MWHLLLCHHVRKFRLYQMSHKSLDEFGDQADSSKNCSEIFTIHKAEKLSGFWAKAGSLLVKRVAVRRETIGVGDA